MQHARNDQVYVLLANGFEESDAITVTRALRRAGLAVVLVGLAAGSVRGSYGVSLVPDRTLSEIEASRPLAVVVPGGVQGARQLNADPRVHALLRGVIQQGGYLVALEAGYVVLHTAGVLNGTGSGRAAGSGAPWQGGALGWRIVVDGRLIWGRDSAAAQETAMVLVSFLDADVGGRS